MKKITLLFAIVLTSFAFGQNTSLDFDGSDDYVTLGDTYQFNNTDAFTVEAWVKAQNTGNFMQIVSKLNSAFTGWGLQVHEDGQLSSYLFSDYLNNQIFTKGTTIIVDDAWHHVAMTFDGVKTMRLFVDGEEEEYLTNDLTGGALGEFTTTVDTHIGNYAGDGAPGEFFLGQIDEVRIWSQELSENDIEDNFETEITGNEPGLAGYYKMDAQGLPCDVVSCAPSLVHGTRGGDIGANNLPQYADGAPGLTDVACGAQMDCLLGLDDRTISTIDVYPNPTNGIIQITSENPIETITISSITGAIIKRLPGSVQLDITDLPAGIYFMTMSANEQQVSQKIIKQ